MLLPWSLVLAAGGHCVTSTSQSTTPYFRSRGFARSFITNKINGELIYSSESCAPWSCFHLWREVLSLQGSSVLRTDNNLFAPMRFRRAFALERRQAYFKRLSALSESPISKYGYQVRDLGIHHVAEVYGQLLLARFWLFYDRFPGSLVACCG